MAPRRKLSIVRPLRTPVGEPDPREVRRRLLAWFDGNRRDLPWRRTRDPYRILVAEYLLQRTRVASGAPYYERFLARFPTVRDLAVVPIEDVLRTWEGLGFYGRARNLHAAAKAIVERHAGVVPRDPAALQELPGMGRYTAGAVASIAYGVAVPAVDGNATRVLARLFRIPDDVTKGSARRTIEGIAARLVDPERPGSFNEALMELGATICTPTSPACPRCPLEVHCLARAAGVEEDLPARARPKAGNRVPVVFGLVVSNGRVLLVRRPERGLLGGLWSLPGGERPRDGDPRRRLRDLMHAQTGLEVHVGRKIAKVERTFSHRRWSGAIYRCDVPEPETPVPGRWMTLEEVRQAPVVSFQRALVERVASDFRRREPAPRTRVSAGPAAGMPRTRGERTPSSGGPVRRSRRP